MLERVEGEKVRRRNSRRVIQEEEDEDEEEEEEAQVTKIPAVKDVYIEE